MKNPELERSWPINEETIWNFRQNHPELIIRDAQAELGLNADQANKLRDILMRRGVNKWLFVRRLLISLKDMWKREILKTEQDLIDTKTNTKDGHQVGRLRGRIKTLTECRQQVRALCHSSRLIEWPRNPREWPENYLPENYGASQPPKTKFKDKKVRE